MSEDDARHGLPLRNEPVFTEADMWVWTIALVGVAIWFLFAGMYLWSIASCVAAGGALALLWLNPFKSDG